MALSGPEGRLGDTNLDFGEPVLCGQFQNDCMPALIKQPVAVCNRHFETVVSRGLVASVFPGRPNQCHVRSLLPTNVPLCEAHAERKASLKNRRLGCNVI